MKKAGGAEAPKAESSASNRVRIGSRSQGGAGNAVPTKSVDQIVDAYIQKRMPGEIKNSVSEGDIARMKERFKSELQKSGQDPKIADEISKEQYRRMAMADEVYHHYNRPALGKPQPTITEAQLNNQLKGYDGPTEVAGWLACSYEQVRSRHDRGPQLGECRQGSSGGSLLCQRQG